MPQFACLIYAADSAHAPEGSAEATEEAARQKAECDAHSEELAGAAVMTHAWAFTPRSMARHVTAAGVQDGVVADGGRIVAGVYLLEAPDLESALALAATNPALAHGGAIEVRPVHSGGAVTEGS